MRLLRFMGYPINNCSTLERAMARQALAVRAAGGAALVAFDGVRRTAAAQAFADEAGADVLHTGLAGFRAGAGALVRGADLARHAAQAESLIRRFRPDVVHSYFGPSAAVVNELALLHPRIRFVRSIGSTPVASARGARHPQLRRLKWRLCLRHQHAVVCVAPHIRDQLLALGVDALRLHVIPNPTDVRRFTPRATVDDAATTAAGDATGDAPLRLVFLGRLDPIKNLPGLLAGVEAACRGTPALRLHLRIHGEGPEHDALAAAIAARGLQAEVQLAGRTDDVAAVLQEADAYVQASHHEGAPAAVGEAMAAGLPLLLSDIPAHRAMITPGLEGLLFDPRDPQALAAALRMLARDPALRRRMGARARATAERELALERWVERELALHASLLAVPAPLAWHGSPDA